MNLLILAIKSPRIQGLLAGLIVGVVIGVFIGAKVIGVPNDEALQQAADMMPQLVKIITVLNGG